MCSIKSVSGLGFTRSVYACNCGLEFVVVINGVFCVMWFPPQTKGERDWRGIKPISSIKTHMVLRIWWICNKGRSCIGFRVVFSCFTHLILDASGLFMNHDCWVCQSLYPTFTCDCRNKRRLSTYSCLFWIESSIITLLIFFLLHPHGYRKLNEPRNACV